MINCHVNVTMTSFTPSKEPGGYAEVTATMELTSQTPNPDTSAPPYYTLEDDTLQVAVPKGTPCRAEYTLINKTGSTDLFYIFGAFFTYGPKQVSQNIGAFPVVMLVGDIAVKANIDGYDVTPSTYTISIVDSNEKSGYWEYTLGIQDLNSGSIGLFDPGYDNEE